MLSSVEQVFELLGVPQSSSAVASVENLIAWRNTSNHSQRSCLQAFCQYDPEPQSVSESK